MKKKGIVFLSFVLVLEAQNIDISKFYYRDYLDFGQGYGAFNGEFGVVKLAVLQGSVATAHLLLWGVALR